MGKYGFRAILQMLACVIGMLCLWLWLDAPASVLAHQVGGEPILDLPRCSARSTVCQVAPSVLNPQDSQADHLCFDGIGVARSCKLSGPFSYLTLASQSADVEAQAFNTLGSIPCVDGLADRYPCQNVDLLSFVPLAEMGGGEGSDMWGWTDPISKREYALVGRTNGTSFVDVTDPTNPLYLGNLPSYDGVETFYRDLKVYKGHLFIVRDSEEGQLNHDPESNHGVQIFDLTTLPALSQQYTSTQTSTTPPVLFETTAHYPHVNLAHNLFINEETGFAYVVGQQGGNQTCNQGLHMIDISNPIDPVFAGCFGQLGYTHDAQCVIYRGPDFRFHGREICFNSNINTLAIVDVTDKELPVLLSLESYQWEESTNGAGIYVHQGWLTGDQRYFIQGDEYDEYSSGANTRTHFWDVSDLQNPQWKGFHEHDTDSIDHNLYVNGSYVFEANYKGGLRVLNIRDAASASLREIAYFDTYPNDGDSESADVGAWSVYPFFESGTIVVNTITEGLFVLRAAVPAEFAVTPTERTLLRCSAQSERLLAAGPLTDVNLTTYHGYTGRISLSSIATGPDGFQSESIQLESSQVRVDGPRPYETEIGISAANGLPAGNYTIAITGEDGENSRSTGLELRIAAAVPSAPESLTTLEEEEGYVDLLWSLSNGGEDVEYVMIEVASDETFNNMLTVGRASAISGSESYRFNHALAGNAPFYWRVRSINGCGEAASPTADYGLTATGPENAQAVFLPMVHGQ